MIAAEGSRLLTRDAGRRLRNVHDEGGAAPAWEEVLPLYAELQIELIADDDDALALGTPDRRPELLRGARDGAARGGTTQPERFATSSSGLGDAVPPTVVHEEATDGNVFVRDGRVRFIDWAEASVSHPFSRRAAAAPRRDRAQR